MNQIDQIKESKRSNNSDEAAGKADCIFATMFAQYTSFVH